MFLKLYKMAPQIQFSISFNWTIKPDKNFIKKLNVWMKMWYLGFRNIC